MLGVEQDLSYLLADSGIAGIAQANGLHPFVLQPSAQESCLGALATAVRAIEYNELALELVFQQYFPSEPFSCNLPQILLKRKT
jgi:hypothetical protein